MTGKLIQTERGGLQIYHQPAEGFSYAIGVDTSAGVRGGNPSCAQVIEVKSCAQVAEYWGHYDPIRWGYACARLGWLYNEAWVVFETMPSMHGLSSYEAAANYGYSRLWQQQKWDRIDGTFTTTKGFHRGKGHETAVLLDRIRQALGEGNEINSEGLLDELEAVYLDGGETILDGPNNTHSDRVVAYAIALVVRDEAYRQGFVQHKPQPVGDLAERYWTERSGVGTGSSGLGVESLEELDVGL
jgi:hypothetical protein